MNKSKLFLIAILICTFGIQANSQNKRKLEKIWETDTIMRVPESVLFDDTRNTLFVSLIDGLPWEADGKGGIAKMSLDGTEVNQEWISGLNCPKGMGISGNNLYVADLTEVVVINIRKGTIENRIKPPGAIQLNDITVGKKGVVYVSDSKAGTVYKIVKENASLYLDSLKGLNGLKFENNELFVAANKQLLRVDENKKLTKIADLDFGGDGIEPIGNKDWLVSAWPGYIYYVYLNGNVETLLDTHEAKKNTADIGYNRMKGIIYVPTFFAKTVVAYQLK